MVETPTATHTEPSPVPGAPAETGWRRGLRRVQQVVGIVFHGPFETETPDGRAQERLRRIILSGATSMFARVIALAVPLITIKLTLGYLGKEVYGLWMTISAFFAFFSHADLGLGSGLVTALSQATGGDDRTRERQLVSSAFFMLLLVAAAIIVIFIILYLLVPWGRVFNTTSDTAKALVAPLVAALFLPMVINLPFALVQRTQLALQEGFQSNLWQTVGSLLSLCIVYPGVYFKVPPILLITAIGSIVAIVNLANWGWFFLVRRRDLRPTWRAWQSGVAKSLLHTGFGFFLLSILTTIGLTAADNLIIAHACGLQAVPGYSVPARLAVMISMAVTMVCMPLWSANGEALARGDVAWVQRNTRRVTLLAVAITGTGCAALVVFGPAIFHAWLKSTIEVSRPLLLGLGLMQCLQALASPYFMVLNGAGEVFVQIRMFLIFTPLVLLAKYLLALWVGVNGVPWGAVLCYGLIIVPQVYLTAKAIFARRMAPVTGAAC